MASGELGRTKAYDDELRWRIVYQRYGMDLNYREIANNVNIDTSTVCRVVQRFEATGSVSSDPYPHGRDHPLCKLTQTDEFLVLEPVIDHPGNLYYRLLTARSQSCVHRLAPP